MIDIKNVKMIDLIPQNLAKDPQIRAAAAAVDKELQAINSAIDMLAIWDKIDKMPEEIIEHLLWELHITHDEGAGLASTLQEKRQLVKNAIPIHMIKGTKAALERVLMILSMRGQISEWFEYNGDPYMFKIEILEIEGKSIKEETLQLLDRLIKAYKNTRSWLEKINIYLTSRGRLYYGCSAIYGDYTTIYPWNVTEVTGKGKVYLGIGYQAAERTIIYPAKEVS